MAQELSRTLGLMTVRMEESIAALTQATALIAKQPDEVKLKNCASKISGLYLQVCLCLIPSLSSMSSVVGGCRALPECHAKPVVEGLLCVVQTRCHLHRNCLVDCLLSTLTSVVFQWAGG